MAKTKTVQFTDEEMVRLRWCCQTLGITFAEFVHIAVIDKCDELEGVSRAVADRNQGIVRAEGFNGRRE